MERYKEYKDSQNVFLREIPVGWNSVKMKYLFIERSEKNHPNEPMLSATQNEGVILQSKYKNRVVVVNKGFEGLKLVKVGDFVIHLRSFQGGIEYTYDQGIISSAYTILKPRSHKNADYFKYLFKSTRFIDMLKTCVTGIREGQNINYSKLKQYFIPIPPLPEQRAIVSYLDVKCAKCDKLIAGNEKQITLLQELKQRIIADAVTRGINKNVKHKKTNVSWLGEVPEHWELMRNKSLLILTDEKVGNRKGITLLSLTKQGVIVRELSEGKGKFPKDFNNYLIVNPNNVVFCLFDVDETPRTVGLVRKYGMLTGAYTNFEVNEKLVLPEFIYYYYLQLDDVKGLRPYYTGLRKVVKTNTFLQLRTPTPPLSEQRSIVSYINEKVSKIDLLTSKLQKEIEHLKEYKQRLISDVVTGQIKVCTE
jgi:probable type I restriction-modification system